jgi:serine/arginine repetitive matrix protein 1
MMTGFLGKTKAKTFIGELWNLLLEAQSNSYGIPRELIEMKKNELQKKAVKIFKLLEKITDFFKKFLFRLVKK